MTEPTRATVLQGDCLEILHGLPADSIDAVVTDPPYGIDFMGNGWDRFTPEAFQEFSRQWAVEVFRVLKPGGHLLAFGGTRTYHRLASGVEDAGFEIRDSITWLYGSGFPKSMDVSKAIDKATGEAARWDGWGTALKPASEPIVVARKPFKGTVAANVLEHGTGALNIDGCRVGTSENLVRPAISRDDNDVYGAGLGAGVQRNPTGRFPPNVLLGHDFDCCAEQPAWSKFFPAFRYQAKASTAERPQVDGTAHPTVKPLDLMRWLTRLVTPPGGTVLDPFAGSGTTAEACLVERFSVVAIEREESYLPLIHSRIDRVAA
jgi:hypothetical protein